MNIEEKINKMENCRGKNHDLLEFRQWLTDAMPNHTALKKFRLQEQMERVVHQFG